MRNFVVVCIVLFTMAGTAFSETLEPPKKHAVDLGGEVKMELVLIPAGKFKMGSGESAEDTAAFFNETYRLPTEAEWEYACRAGTTTRYPSGDDPQTLGKVGELVDATAKAKIPDWKYMIRHSDNYVFTSPVGKSEPNVFGLYDMHGNAFQWCADWYGAKYYAASPADDPTGPDSGTHRVIRGGTWSFRPLGARSAERNWTEPDGRNCAAGFRVVRTQ